jgi:pimeloyl-ACP methyl ester carboxylesterase
MTSVDDTTSHPSISPDPTEATPMVQSEQEAEELFGQPPHAFIDVGPGQVAYRKVGHGPDVLLVHGWPVHSATWRKLLPHLAPHVTCHLIDLPGAGQSRWTDETPISLPFSVLAIRRVLDYLDLDDVAVVGFDSGGMLARHAVAGDRRVRSLGLINTEQSQGLTPLFQLFVAAGRLPGFGSILAWASGRRWLRNSVLVLGGTFEDTSLLDGAFDRFFLQPIRDDATIRRACVTLVRSFDRRYVDSLADVHAKIDVPVQLVWGRNDPFFPLAWAEAMVEEFPNAQLAVIDDARLFCHEERPADVAQALLPTLLTNTTG